VGVAPAINITVWSYVEKLNFGLYTYDAFPDLTRVADHLEQAVAELADAAQRVGSGPWCEEGVSSAPRAG
jgi:hypothetical protein